MTALRAVEIVKISLYISIVSLVLNVFINYTLIFGNFGMPELGIRGAAIGTLTARIVELIIVLVYLIRDKRLALFSENFLKGSREMNHNFLQVCIPVYLSAILWAVTVPMQTAILGHLPGRNSSDVIAANSVVTTFYQYLKVISAAMGSAAGVMIGKIIGTGDIEETKAEARSISVICVGIGAVLAILFLIARKPLLSLYSLTPAAMDLANQMMYLFAVIIFSMTYMMPVANGVIRGGGDTHFYLKMNLISVWAIVMPLSFMSAFWWKWPPVWVVLMVQSDQIFKSIPTFLRVRSYKWIHQMAK
jgi:putative MATE family efflux protein